MKEYDYIIAGGGLAGLSLAYRMAKENYFRNQKILIIDQDKKSENDRTWSYWENGDSIFDEIVFKKWQTVQVFDYQFGKKENIAPFVYKTIKSNDFYSFVKQQIEKSNNISWCNERIESVDIANSIVICKKNVFKGGFIFDSYFETRQLQIPNGYHYLKQHFYGEVIKTQTKKFDSDTVTYMDMRTPQHDGLHFVYILPFNEYEALVEYTVFSENIYEKSFYKQELYNYLNQHQLSDIEVLEDEFGIIPMTDFPFTQNKASNHLYIGTKGGFAKPSTGYAFERTQRICAQIIDQITNGKMVYISHSKTMLLMDAVLLRAIKKQKHETHKIFRQLYDRNSVKSVLKFLDEQSTPKEILKIMNSTPILLFIRFSLEELISIFRRKLKFNVK